MHRILILDSDHPLRERLIEALRRTPNTEVAIASDTQELLSMMKLGAYAAVFVDGDLLGGEMARLNIAVRACTVRPMVVIASNEKTDDLDPDLVTLLVRKPYDVLTLTGVLLSAVTHLPADLVDKTDSPAAN